MAALGAGGPLDISASSTSGLPLVLTLASVQVLRPVLPSVPLPAQSLSWPGSWHLSVGGPFRQEESTRAGRPLCWM